MQHRPGSAAPLGHCNCEAHKDKVAHTKVVKLVTDGPSARSCGFKPPVAATVLPHSGISSPGARSVIGVVVLVTICQCLSSHALLGPRLRRGWQRLPPLALGRFHSTCNARGRLSVSMLLPSAGAHSRPLYDRACVAP